MKTFKINSLLTMLVLFISMTVIAQQQKQDISVLYVGFDPAIPVSKEIINSATATGAMSIERFNDDIKTRYAAFESYLKNYFSKVTSVDARSYKMDMSANYDVTIFDQSVNPLKEAVREVGADGKMINEPPTYLTEDFDAAAIFIGHTAPVMGESVGSKLDWLCLCLDADAHHLKTEHPIFNGPYKVNLTMVEKPTPEGIFHYPSGKHVAKQIPMWRVQKEGYLEGKGYRVGLVSRGSGFLDSPDTEYISSGVNTKDVDAVAIGRHGNFFLWGFSGSPDYMTDEAKQVFANAVVYMKQFKGKKPIVRKYNTAIATRDALDGILFRANKEAYQDYIKMMEGFNVSQQAQIQDIKKKKADGKELNQLETMLLGIEGREQAIDTWPEYVKSTTRTFFKEEYVDDISQFHTFVKENRPYIYSEPDARFEFQVDQEAKTLGIANNDIALLEKCVSLLKKGEQTNLANTLLTRYTGMQKSVAEWEAWLNKNKSKLFFTESGGYNWMVDTTK